MVMFPYLSHPRVVAVSVDKCNESFKSEPLKKSGSVRKSSYHANMMCTYEFEAVNQERVLLNISRLNLAYTGGDPTEPYGYVVMYSFILYAKIDLLLAAFYIFT